MLFQTKASRYMRHLISGEKVRTGLKEIEAMLSFTRPTNTKALRNSWASKMLLQAYETIEVVANY